MEEIRSHAANARFRRRQAETRAHGPAHPRPGFGCLRPDVFLKRAQDHTIKTLQPRFQKTEDGNARMCRRITLRTKGWRNRPGQHGIKSTGP